MIITRLISLTNFAVASSALGFQVFVLYPWHIQLDESFEELKKEHIRVLEAAKAVAREVESRPKNDASASILARLGMSNLSTSQRCVRITTRAAREVRLASYGG
ncbi:hypothetical protein F4778DRAFT_786718 [Xylariomycetidae sp. FL2044]|nr:hypothetical protein F4778DRAFT_786718 [Xylariomycetidae sp. FL2044]